MTDMACTGMGRRTDDDEYVYERLDGPLKRTDLFHVGAIGWYRVPSPSEVISEPPMYFPGANWQQDRMQVAFA
jgi:hypothetical protein